MIALAHYLEILSLLAFVSGAILLAGVTLDILIQEAHRYFRRLYGQEREMRIPPRDWDR